MAHVTREMYDGFMEADMRMAAFMIALQAEIVSLPDNENIKRIGAGCFIIQSSQLREQSWAPTHYDYRHQYTVLADIIDHSERPTVLRKLSDILGEGAVKHNGERVRFHPDVIANVRGMLTTIGYN